MKLVVAIIRPAEIEAVRVALAQRGLCQATLTPAQGWGHEVGPTLHYRGVAQRAPSLDRIRIEIAVEEAQAREAVAIIDRAAGRGQPGDGVIWVSELDQFVSLRQRAGCAAPARTR